MNEETLYKFNEEVSRYTGGTNIIEMRDDHYYIDVDLPYRKHCLATLGIYIYDDVIEYQMVFRTNSNYCMSFSGTVYEVDIAKLFEELKRKMGEFVETMNIVINELKAPIEIDET